jgi:sucrose-6-phosphate hydrolase SacC (GH32 family)
MIKVGPKWYWWVFPLSPSTFVGMYVNICRIGEDKTNGTSFINVNCYSSSNLIEWTYEGALLSQTESGDTGPGRVIERPKVIYNKMTSKYVLWMHIDSANYTEAKIGVAAGDSVCGRYTYLRSEQPLGFQSRDSSVYVDDDGKGYLLTEDVSLQSRYRTRSKLMKAAPKWPPH